MFSLQFHDTVNVKKSKIKRGLIMCLRSSWRFVNARKNGGTYKRKSVWIFAKRGSNSTSQSSKQNFFSQDNSEDQTASQALRTVDGTKKFKEAGKVAHVVWNSPYLLSLSFHVSENHSKKLNVKNEPKEYGGEKRRCKQIL